MRSASGMFLIVTAWMAASAPAPAASVAGVEPSARDYPNRPLRMIVPFAPGGTTDVVGRIVAQKLTESLGQQVVIDNRAGAGGNIGTGIAARAGADGYTLLAVSSSFVVNPSLYAAAPYDALRDFAPITVAASSPNSIIVHPSFAAKSVKELIELARPAGARLGFSVPGIGTTPHLAGELFRMTYKLDLASIPFNGAGPSVAAVVANQVPIGFAALPTATQHIKGGALRALAILAPKRSAAVPDVPTAEEAGVKELESDTIAAVLAPAGTPRAIVARLNGEIVKIIRSPDVARRLSELGFEGVANTPEQFAALIRTEIDKWGKVVKAAGIKVE